MNLQAAGEFGLIAALERFFPKAGTTNMFGGVLFGPGDDCAVYPIPSGDFLLLTTDMMVERRHFLRSLSSPYQIGQKLLAVNLSDIAAMGGTPGGVLLTLNLPRQLEVTWVEALYEGVSMLARQHGVPLLGGDTVESSVLSLGITAFGFTKQPPVLRSGANTGDDLWVSGTIGDGGAGLRILQERGTHIENHSWFVERYQAPTPRLELGQLLLERGIASSMIDVSDGLLQDAGHLAKKSGKKIVVYEPALPVSKGIPCEDYSAIDAMTAGDDYELLFTAKPEHREAIQGLIGQDAMPPLTRIGSVEALPAEAGEGEVFVASATGTPPRAKDLLEQVGYEHFRGE